MNRLFGSSTSKPKPNLADAIASTDVRIDSIEVKVRKLDAELTKYRDQMRRMKEGPGKVRRHPLVPFACVSSAPQKGGADVHLFLCPYRQPSLSEHCESSSRRSSTRARSASSSSRRSTWSRRR